MSPQEQDTLKAFLGDGMAKVTISKDLSEMDFGNGGKVRVTVTLSCDQSTQAIEYAKYYAKAYVDKFCDEDFAELRNRCVQLRLLKPHV